MIHTVDEKRTEDERQVGVRGGNRIRATQRRGAAIKEEMRNEKETGTKKRNETAADA